MKHQSGKKPTNGKTYTRRDFLHTAVRLGLGGALGLIGFMLLGGRARNGRSASCVSNYYCRACVRAPGCPLPQAMSFRKKFGG
jgi:predicted alpha/beta-hydrolase family hydrolase